MLIDEDFFLKASSIIALGVVLIFLVIVPQLKDWSTVKIFRE